MSLPKPHFSRRHLPHRLRRLIGTWTVEGRFVGGTEVRRVRGSAAFRWLVKDALVVTRTRMTVAPASSAVLGADDTHNAFTMLYSDERGVVRRYEMTLTARRWTLVRRAPGFSQRFIGALSANGRSISATWEKSADGRRWLRDFDLIYTKRS
ncbi:MAG: hypothetical protein DME50_00155 [Verrucomicrobia bacterium]|nr:MAG: hypothetical protein DME50_00155 [Verrucomicrobiota bacterium]